MRRIHYSVTLTLFPLFLLLLDDDILFILSGPLYLGFGGPFGLADEGSIVILANAHRRRGTLQIDDIRRN